MGRAVQRPPTPSNGRVRYDGDQRLLAFAGAVSFLVGTLFWALTGLRYTVQGLSTQGAASDRPLALACFAIAVAGLLLTLVAWGLRAKMQRGDPLTHGEMARMLIGGLVVGVIIGFLIYAALHFKLQDPDFYHMASPPENIPPAVR